MNNEDLKETMRERYFEPMFQNGLRPDRLPHLQSVMAHRGKVADDAYEHLFSQAHSEIMLDLFLRWAQTDLGETELRESLYQNVLALGAVRNKIVEFSQYGRNAPFILESANEEEED